MTTRILMTKVSTGESGYVFNNATPADAAKIVEQMNRLDVEAARLTGQAIKYVFSLVIDKK